MFPGPVVTAQFRDTVIVCRLAANIHHAVDGCGAAQNASTYPRFGCVGVGLLGIALVQPQILRVSHDLGEALWHANEGVIVARACFQEGDFYARISR